MGLLPVDNQSITADLSLLYRLHKDREDFLNEERSLTLRIKARLRRLASTTCDNHSAKCKRCVGLASECFPAHWDPKLRIPRGQVVAAASIVSPKY